MVNLTRSTDTWVRFRNPDQLIREIRQVATERDVKFIDFHDDTFILRRDWLHQFLPAYQREIQIPFSCQIRADLMTDAIASLLKSAGCARVSFGLESGDETIRTAVLKKGITDRHIRNAASILNRVGIPFFTTNMMGLPGETLSQAMKTLELNLEIGTRCAWVSIFQPFPGTRLADYCLEHSYLEHPISTDDPVDTHTSSLLKQPQIAEVVRLQKFAYVAIRFPKMLPLIRQLIRYDYPRLYLVIHRISYFLLYFRQAYQASWREMIRHAWLAWRHYE